MNAARILPVLAALGMLVAPLAGHAADTTDSSSTHKKHHHHHGHGKKSKNPTADSAAEEQGKSPESAMQNGHRVEPSERIPSTDQVRREQPGTMPPQNGQPAAPVSTPDSSGGQ